MDKYVLFRLTLRANQLHLTTNFMRKRSEVPTTVYMKGSICLDVPDYTASHHSTLTEY